MSPRETLWRDLLVHARGSRAISRRRFRTEGPDLVWEQTFKRYFSREPNDLRWPVPAVQAMKFIHGCSMATCDPKLTLALLATQVAGTCKSAIRHSLRGRP